MFISKPFAAGFAFILGGYLSMSCSMQYWFYARQQHRIEDWKVQPDRKGGSGQVANSVWIPLLSSVTINQDTLIPSPGAPPRKVRAKDHWLLSSINLAMASSIAGTVAHLCVRGKTRMVFTLEDAGGVAGLIGWTGVAFAVHNVAEYYWHRLMHHRYFYSRLHKLHHFYKSPEPFDDLYIHPLEAAGYYSILYSPPFTLPIHAIGFGLYMAVMGLCGVLDHSGVRLRVPGLYATEDHDLHHSKFEVNYAFPHPLMDILHGTFSGSCLGLSFPYPPPKTWLSLPRSTTARQPEA
mmetsp:Transcript_38357/g.96073  ORF Transcript_38357/g.96073 Transcript_38357/m.96073 type:complete len:293 (-) Transcript_38357:143-1021(-)|eukprot:CAMPEP_0173444596 /NCGR_PEP_ID=MMETSP1357-20121228/32556_1 /TAXON_ID=77926 /ORGANISM="Hemiselmis rufescens, Strain PCC563" /LENGTH=292 /DNA_ID=CAMNT_0014410655 /DNA_START=15 /DNA_END=893 /DNA_ORIENTATION=+